jgi:uncharacterized iron-regulated protein
MFLPVLGLLAVLTLTVGCGAMRIDAQPRSIADQPNELEVQPQPPVEETRQLAPGDIIDAKTGKLISFETLMDQLSDARIVYVGETHTSLEDHRIQLQVLKGMYARNSSLALAMEMFPFEAQPQLDRYSAGLITEERFLKSARWEKVWGYPFQLYRPILTWARERGLKLIGLNAPHEVVRKIARTGLASLTSSERKRVAAEFHLDDQEHRDYVRQQYEQHLKSSIKSFETFYEAQLAWEETMADTLARSLRFQPENQQITVLIGNGHIVDKVGAPRLANLRVEHVNKTIVTLPVDLAVQEIDPKIGDFVWITSKSETAHRGRLGIMLLPVRSGKGLEVVDVIPDGPAAKAGVRKGDVLRKIDGIVVKNMDALHKTLAGEKPDHELTVKRGRREVVIRITLPTKEQ